MISKRIWRPRKNNIQFSLTCKDISMLCRCNYKNFFFNHVKYKNMHSPTSGKVNQLQSTVILWNLDGVASNHLFVKGNCFTLYFLVVFCGGQLEGSTFVTGRSKRTKGRTLGRLDWASPNLKRLAKSMEKKKHYFWFTSIGQSEVGTQTLNSPILCFSVSLTPVSSRRLCRAKLSTWLSWIYKYV